mmetsp:Transcript_38740/g.104891  ORF Transcript_38740/g.104891 Transcript_38740/m.104891 type:complete len:264 (+) Transcript_38740:253-1044(+)
MLRQELRQLGLGVLARRRPRRRLPLRACHGRRRHLVRPHGAVHQRLLRRGMLRDLLPRGHLAGELHPPNGNQLDSGLEAIGSLCGLVDDIGPGHGSLAVRLQLLDQLRLRVRDRLGPGRRAQAHDGHQSCVGVLGLAALGLRGLLGEGGDLRGKVREGLRRGGLHGLLVIGAELARVLFPFLADELHRGLEVLATVVGGVDHVRLRQGPTDRPLQELHEQGLRVSGRHLCSKPPKGGFLHVAHFRLAIPCAPSPSGTARDQLA